MRICNNKFSIFLRLPREKHCGAVTVAYGIFMKLDYGDAIRSATLERVAISLLRSLHSTAVNEFFRSHIVEIMEVIEGKTNKVKFKLFCFNHLLDYFVILSNYFLDKSLI